MMLFNDVTIVCSIILAGKPLCMHRQSTNGRLHTCQCPCQLTVLTESMKCCHFVSEPIFVPVTYIYIYIYYIYIYIYIYILNTPMTCVDFSSIGQIVMEKWVLEIVKLTRCPYEL